MPDYIICFDTIKETDKIVAKEMGIPIVIIHTEFYKNAVNNISFLDNTFGDTEKYKKI